MKIEDFKERVNYTFDGKYYTGYSVNLPQVVVQAETKEELEQKLLIRGKLLLDAISKSFDRGFELMELEYEK